MVSSAKTARRRALGRQLEAYWASQIPYRKRMGQSAEYTALVQHVCEKG